MTSPSCTPHPPRALSSCLAGFQASIERIKSCAEILNSWYKREGYLLSEISNAEISSDGDPCRMFFSLGFLD